MNSVGIDVSKGRSTVAVMRPFGEVVISPFEVRHTNSELSAQGCSKAWTVRLVWLWKPQEITIRRWRKFPTTQDYMFPSSMQS